MNHLHAKGMIACLFDNFVDAWSGTTKMNNEPLPPDVGAAFGLRIDIQNYGYERDGNTKHDDWERRFHKFVAIVITSRRRVYVAVTDTLPSSIEQIDPAAFVNTSNHDSCWQEGMNKIDEVIGEGYGYCYDHVPDRHRPNMNNMSIFSTFGFGLGIGRPMQYVRVTRGAYVDPENRYFDTLKKIEQLQMRIEVVEKGYVV